VYRIDRRFVLMSAAFALCAAPWLYRFLVMAPMRPSLRLEGAYWVLAILTLLAYAVAVPLAAFVARRWWEFVIAIAPLLVAAIFFAAFYGLPPTSNTTLMSIVWCAFAYWFVRGLRVAIPSRRAIAIGALVPVLFIAFFAYKYVEMRIWEARHCRTEGARTVCGFYEHRPSHGQVTVERSLEPATRE
jgi:hypothetical protein